MLFLALKYLVARKRQTILTLLGIFFGTVAFIVISGLFLGFRGYLLNQLINNSGHVYIQSREDFITEHELDKYFFGMNHKHVFWSSPPSGRINSDLVENPGRWFRILKHEPSVVAFSSQLTAAVILSKGKTNITTTLTGCDPIQQTKVTTIGSYMKQGEFKDLSVGGNRIILGEELRKRLGVVVGQTIQVSLADGNKEPFKVAGIFETGNKIVDANAYGSIKDVQKINQTPNRINQISVKLSNFELSKKMAGIWRQLSNEKIESWDEKNSSIFNVFHLQDAIRFLTIFSIMIVAGFGIYNVLNIMVIQKKKDIAILRSLGFDKSEIISLFLSQGLILGLTGSSLGLLIGYLICLYIQTLPFGGGPMGGPGFLQISFSLGIYVSAFGLAILATCIASFFPAYSAGKLTPIDIIRSGAE